MATPARTPARTAARTTVRRRVLGAVAVAAAAAGVVTGSGAAQADPQSLVGDGAQAWHAYELVNAARVQNGLPALGLSDDANRVASDWAFRMAGDAQLKHNPDLSRQLNGWSLVAENVGVGADADQLQSAFMNSPGHRANILRPEVGVAGFGAVRSQDGRLWVVQVFEQPNGPVAGFHPAPAPAPAQTAAQTAPQALPAGGSDAPVLDRGAREVA
ncbi:CAP domain-containing protein [Kineococcus rhizosphaerae]|uniref:Uncharacterized protein YkwD n=1 Tax=Kineococcus rhizosphaerae TaxID=559628 RepID=A0A2T0QZE5_9ACTN|nr:CAP domain-containing protein [Kineococcus rhizosphaerae]PRY12067.1 uncharacterized protein YkwD [Kineococcus rhizosphaerae]